MKDPKSAVIYHIVPKGQLQYGIIVSATRSTDAANSTDVMLSIKPIGIHLDGLEYIERVDKRLFPNADKVFDEIQYAFENSNVGQKMIDIRYCGVDLTDMIMSIRYQGKDGKYVAMDFLLSADKAKVRELFGRS